MLVPGIFGMNNTKYCYCRTGTHKCNILVTRSCCGSLVRSAFAGISVNWHQCDTLFFVSDGERFIRFVTQTMEPETFELQVIPWSMKTIPISEGGNHIPKI